MKKIWIVAPFTNIEENNYRNRFVYLANLLSENNYEVTLFTSGFSHLKKTQIEKKAVKKYPFKIRFIEEPGYEDNVSFERIKSHIKFSLNLKREIRNLEKPNLLYVAYPTMSASYVCESYAKKNNIPVIIDVQDTWPESISTAIDTKRISLKIALTPLKLIANHIYKNANGIVGVSKTYVDRAKISNSKSKFYNPVYIGTNLETFDKAFNNSNNITDEENVNLIYIGTLSYSYDIETVIQGLGTLEDNLNLKLYILGDGPQKKFLIKRAEELNVLNTKVIFLGYLKYHEMVAMLKQSNIALNSIKGESKATITNKLGDYLAAGLPVLNSCMQKEIIDLVNDEEIGMNYIPGDSESFKKILAKMLSNKDKLKDYGGNARSLAVRQFDRKNSYKMIIDAIETLI